MFAFPVHTVIISSSMRNIMTKNSLALLLLMTFLMTNVGNALGYAWCFGDDGHSKIEQATLNGCADRGDGCSTRLRYAREGLSNVDVEQSRPCSDLLLDRSNAFVSKRIVKDTKVDSTLKAQVASSPVAYNQQIKSKYISHSPRVSQAVLAQRTVVLLN